MKLNIRATAFALGILSGVAMLVTGLANTIWPGYGTALLQLLASIYPGFEAAGTASELVTGILYAVADGGLFGLVFAWLYNQFTGTTAAVTAEQKQQAGVAYPSVEPES